MKCNPTGRSRPRLTVLAIIVGLVAAIIANGCGADTAGFACTSDDECPDDLACEVNEQGAVCSDVTVLIRTWPSSSTRSSVRLKLAA